MMAAMRRLGIGTVLLGLLVYVALTVGGRRDVVPRYETIAADRGPIRAVVTATGTVNPVAMVQVGTYVSGPITEIHADFNTPVARGQLLGDNTGMLKLLIHQDNHQILGVHAIGTGATELIHIGQAVMALGGSVDYFINNVFNFPTLAEAYKVAAYNGLNKLRHI